MTLTKNPFTENDISVKSVTNEPLRSIPSAYSFTNDERPKKIPEVKVDEFGNVVIGKEIIIYPSQLDEFTKIMNNLKDYMSYD